MPERGDETEAQGARPAPEPASRDPRRHRSAPNSLPPGPGEHPTTALPRGTGGQQPPPASRIPPRPRPPEPTTQLPRDPRSGRAAGTRPEYQAPRYPDRDDYRGREYADREYRDSEYEDRQRRNYSDRPGGGRIQPVRGRDYPEPEYREPEYREPDYRDRAYREPDYREPDHREPTGRDREPEYRDRSYRDRDYREPEYREPEYREPEYGDRDRDRRNYSEPGYRDHPYRKSGDRDHGYRDPERREPEHREPEHRDLERRPGERNEPQRHRGDHLPPYTAPDPAAAGDRRGPRKLTVTRVAALRSKELTNRGVQLFHKAASADGADRSGLTHLTYAVMANYAVDAALTVALANTLFFAAASAESTGKVLLYLLITVAPFAVIAPFIGPLLDRIQNGRRIALAACSFGRSLLAIVMAFNFNSWLLYPCALGMMVLSKSFGVLKAALTPRVLPEQITLVKTNSRLTVFGLVAGGVSGGIAAAFAALSNSSGALIWTALCGVAGGLLCLRIPSWVESTEGEVPVQHSVVIERNRRRFPPMVAATLWANVANRVETGFLALFIAFVVKTEYSHVTGFKQLLLLGIVGAAAGAGGFLGNALGARLHLTNPAKIAWLSVLTVGITTLVAMLVPGLAMGAVVGLVGSTSSSLAKVCLDSVLQHELPEASRASAFGMSESALQLAWVFGGVVGLLFGGILHLRGNPVYTIGFGVVTLLVALGLVQSWLARSGRTMMPNVSIGTLFRHTPKDTGPDTRPGPGPGHGPGPGPGPGGTMPMTAAGSSGGTERRRRTPRRAGKPR